MLKKFVPLVLSALLVISFAGCGSHDNGSSPSSDSGTSGSPASSESTAGNSSEGKISDVEVRFGPNGKAYIMHTDDNDTAVQLVRDIGEAGLNLPIYHFNDFKDYQVMQYYDIPDSYKVPSDPETVTSEKAGEVYYSAPNRVILFYQDAKISAKYTKVGHLENTDGLKEAVENSPVMQGWGNKIISVRYAK